ncbi:MAG: PASTA domain-containing protein [Defluviitaleaceae bacterium]|nr:PASTA domain-containing protein [Defluviitaleaceae bacterium]
MELTDSLSPVADSPHLASSSALRDNYVIEKLIGYGGFGATYIGWDKAGDRQVAIREYFPAEFSTRVPGRSEISIFNDSKKQKQFHDGLVKFLEEAKQISKLQGEDGIINIYDSFEANNTAYIIMEYLDGNLLSEIQGGDNKHNRYNATVAIDFVMPIIKSLKTLHDAGIYHLDIAPNNIFMTSKGKTKLIDFSAYRHVTTSYTRSLSVIVKPGFSPEELYRSSGDLGAHTDVYAIGAVLYRLLTGVVPPDAMSRRMNLENGRKDPLKSIRNFNSKVSKSQENAIMNALNVQIKDRTPDVSTFADELTSDNAKRRGQKVGFLDIGKWSGKAKAIVGTGAAAIITVVVLILIGVFAPPEFEIPEGMVAVPNVVNESRASAEALLEAENLLPFIVGREFSQIIPPGFVLLQDVSAGTFVPVLTRVSLTISYGAEMVLLPFVVGFSADEAQEELESVGFSVRRIYEYSRFIVEGAVIRTNFDDANSAVLGATVRLYISRGPDPESDEPYLSDVPNIEGLTLEDAIRISNEAGFAVEVIHRRYGTEPRYEVISQSLNAGTRTMTDNIMGLVISLGERVALLPDLQARTLEDAQRVLNNAGFNTNVTTAHSETVARGLIISQSPAPGTLLYGTAVSIVVSAGGLPFAAPNVTGLSEDVARSALNTEGLMVSISYEPGNPEGNVIRQSPDSGSQVVRGDTIYLVVTNNRPVNVPNVEGMTREAAENALRNAGLRSSAFENFHETVAVGHVISFSPSGTQPETTIINLMISAGREPVPVPTGLTGMEKVEAERRIFAANLRSVVTEEHHDTIAAGIVISQNPASGMLFRNDPVSIVISLGAEEVSVPNVVGQTQSAAQNTLQAQRFHMEVVDEQFSNATPPVPAGNVMLQTPNAGQILTRGGTVRVTLSLGPVPNHRITYDRNDGTGTMQPVYVRNGLHHFASQNQFTRANFVFESWNTQANGQGTRYDAGQRINNIEAPITLYAQWERDFIVTYHSNDGTGNAPTVPPIKPGQSHIVIHNPFNRANYTFTNWNTQANGNGTSYSPGDPILNIRADINLFAQWVPATVPVININMYYSPQNPVAGTPIVLSGVVSPSNATHQTIVWSVFNQGTTGATINGNTLNTTAAGTVTVQATIVNGISVVPPQNYTKDFSIDITVASVAPIITSGNSTSIQHGVGGIFNVIATGVPQQITFSLSNAPSGVTIDGNSGVMTIAAATAGGTHSFLITASNAAGNSTPQNFTLIITMNPPTITSANNTSVQHGAGGTFNVTATGTTPITFSLSGEPSGISINNSGAINISTAVAAGTHNFTITASNDAGNVQQSFSLTVTGSAPAFTSANSTSVPYGTGGAFSVTAGGTMPIIFALSGAPAGVAIDNNGNLSIAASVPPGSHSFTITATNAVGNTQQGFTLTVQPPAHVPAIGVTLTITPPTDYGLPFPHIPPASGGTQILRSVQYTLSGVVAPENATNTAITWSIQNAGTTGATITGVNGNIINTTGTGAVTVRATIVGGGATATANFTQDFVFAVVDE